MGTKKRESTRRDALAEMLQTQDDATTQCLVAAAAVIRKMYLRIDRLPWIVCHPQGQAESVIHLTAIPYRSVSRTTS